MPFVEIPLVWQLIGGCVWPVPHTAVRNSGELVTLEDGEEAVEGLLVPGMRVQVREELPRRVLPTARAAAGEVGTVEYVLLSGRNKLLVLKLETEDKKKQQAVMTHNLANPTLGVLIGEYGEDRCYVSPANVRPLCRLRRGSGSPPEAAPQCVVRVPAAVTEAGAEAGAEAAGDQENAAGNTPAPAKDAKRQRGEEGAGFCGRRMLKLRRFRTVEIPKECTLNWTDTADISGRDYEVLMDLSPSDLRFFEEHAADVAEVAGV